MRPSSSSLQDFVDVDLATAVGVDEQELHQAEETLGLEGSGCVQRAQLLLMYREGEEIPPSSHQQLSSDIE